MLVPAACGALNPNKKRRRKRPRRCVGASSRRPTRDKCKTNGTRKSKRLVRTPVPARPARRSPGISCRPVSGRPRRRDPPCKQSFADSTRSKLAAASTQRKCNIPLFSTKNRPNLPIAQHTEPSQTAARRCSPRTMQSMPSVLLTPNQHIGLAPALDHGVLTILRATDSF